jgi:hypothetical protein
MALDVRLVYGTGAKEAVGLISYRRLGEGTVSGCLCRNRRAFVCDLTDP